MSNEKQPDDGQMISKARARAIMLAMKRAEQEKFDAKVAEMQAQIDALKKERTEPYNNRQKMKRASRHQRQLALLREAAAKRLLTAWGQTNVARYLRGKGTGCAPETASDLTAKLVEEGFLVRAPSGRAKLPPIDGAMAA